MSAPRLARLRSVRAIELRRAMHDLAAAQRATLQATALQTRLTTLIGDLPCDGPRQPIAATRAVLVATRDRVAARGTASAAERDEARGIVERRQRRLEAVDAALDRARLR